MVVLGIELMDLEAEINFFDLDNGVFFLYRALFSCQQFPSFRLGEGYYWQQGISGRVNDTDLHMCNKTWRISGEPFS